MRAITDPLKIHLGDPGRPDICNVFTYHRKFNASETAEIEKDCQSGKLGCVACKKKLAAKLADYLAPFQEKRHYFEQHEDEVRDIIKDGTASARKVAAETMDRVQQAMKIG